MGSAAMCPKIFSFLSCVVIFLEELLYYVLLVGLSMVDGFLGRTCFLIIIIGCSEVVL